MPSPVITILDTTVAETGSTQRYSAGVLKKDNPSRFSISLASGDTVVIEGKAESADSFEIIHTWTGSETPADLYLSKIWRARRTVDGAAGDSIVKIDNRLNQKLTEHV